MKNTTRLKQLSVALACAGLCHVALAHDGAHTGGIQSAVAKAVHAPYDIVHTKISTQDNVAVFHMQVSGKAGANKPTKTGKLAGARVFSYVWPTSLDPATVGFDAKSGILALAVTSHPDFDDTPLFDESGDGDTKNDGGVWHAHWVVLQAADACGEG
jgi:hypothetical protein